MSFDTCFLIHDFKLRLERLSCRRSCVPLVVFVWIAWQFLKYTILQFLCFGVVEDSLLGDGTDRTQVTTSVVLVTYVCSAFPVFSYFFG